jgi:hypothetical protein
MNNTLVYPNRSACCSYTGMPALQQDTESSVPESENSGRCTNQDPGLLSVDADAGYGPIMPGIIHAL